MTRYDSRVSRFSTWGLTRHLKLTLNLLESTGRRRLLALASASILLPFLDIFGLFLFSLSLNLLLSQGGKGTKSIVGDRPDLQDSIASWMGISNVSNHLVLIAAAIALFILRSVLALILIQVVNRTLVNSTARIASDRFVDIFAMSVNQVAGQNKSKFSEFLINGLGFIVTNGVSAYLSFLSELVFIIAIFLFTFSLFPLASVLISIYLLLFSLLLIKKMKNKANFASSTFVKKNIELREILSYAFPNFREIYLGNQISEVALEVGLNRNEWGEAQTANMTLAAMPKYFLEVIAWSGLLIALLSVNAFSETDQNQIDFALVIVVLSRILPSVLRITSLVTTLRQAASVTDEYWEFLNFLNNPKGYNSEETIHARFNGSNISDALVTCKKLEIYYRPDQVSISCQDFSIFQGDRILLGGESGAGKTTFLDGMLGMLPTKGLALFENTLIRDYINRHPKAIKYVSQNAALVGRSLSDQVARSLSLSKVQEEHLNRILSKLGIKELMDKLKLGIYSDFSDHEIRLSAGQIQRLNLARAVFDSPRLLIIDEGTNALDIKSETKIIDDICMLIPDASIILTSHRLQSHPLFNRKFVVQDGRMSEESK